jgi:hypothetical protein
VVGVTLLVAHLPLQGGAMGQAPKQSVNVPFQPAIKGAEASSFEGKQNPDGDPLTRLPFLMALFEQWRQTIIDFAENMDNYLFGSHGLCLS